MIAVVVALALLGPSLFGDPDLSDFSLLRAKDGGLPLSSLRHPLGVDSIFRDELSRLSTGGRVSLLVAALASLLSTSLGTSIGVFAATLGHSGHGHAEALILRLIDAFLALPFLLFVAAIGLAVGHQNPIAIAVVLGVAGMAGFARVIHRKAREVLARDFVLASRSLGASVWRIAMRHVLPNVLESAAALGINLVAAMVFAEATLSYLAIGIEPPRASWGRMLHESEQFIVTRPILVAAPTAMILLTMLAFHRVGSALSRMSERSPSRFQSPPLEPLVVGLVLLLTFWSPTLKVARPVPVHGDRRGLHLASYVTVRTLDPALAYDEVSVAIGRHVFGRLLTWDRSGKVVPDLAESFAWSADGLSLSLDLKPGLVFHDGRALGAADVKRSIERALHPKTASSAAAQYDALVGFESFRAGRSEHLEGVEAVGENRIVFHLQRPSSTFLALLTLGVAAPVCATDALFASLRSPDPPCGAGPFQVTRFDAEEGVQLSRFGGYRAGALPAIGTIDWRFNVRPTTQRYRFERGELDFIRDLTSVDAEAYQRDQDFNGAWADENKVNGIFLNTEVEPFTNVHLRRAVSLAIDPSVLSRVRADVVEATDIVPRSIPRGIGGARRHFDFEGALREMGEAGYPFDPSTGEGGYPKEIEYVTVPDSFEQFAAEIYGQQLARVGIRIRLQLAPYQAYRAKVSRRGLAQMGWAAWGADFADPSNFFSSMLSTQAIGDVSENFAFFSNPELDQLLDQAEAMPNGAARLGLFGRAEAIVAEEAVWIPTSYPQTLEVWQPRLVDYQPNPLTPLDFSHARLEGVDP